MEIAVAPEALMLTDQDGSRYLPENEVRFYTGDGSIREKYNQQT